MEPFASSTEPSMNYSSDLEADGPDRLAVEDALTYLDRVKETFRNQPQVYNDFLDTIKQFRAHDIDTPGVMTRVSHLFKNHPDLFDGFNAFLPSGFKIEVQHYEQGNGYQVLISMPTHLLLEGTSEMTKPPASVDEEPAIKQEIILETDDAPVVHVQEEIVQEPQGFQPVQFREAMTYVNKIKRRFRGQPAKYQRFLDILHGYQKEQKNMEATKPGDRLLNINEVYNQVAELFDHGDELLEEFGRFFPD